MKANKKTLMAVKQFIQNGEGWDLDEIIYDTLVETKKLVHPEMGNVDADECAVEWDNDTICVLSDLIDEYTRLWLNKFCNVLDSFVDEVLSNYDFD